MNIIVPRYSVIIHRRLKWWWSILRYNLYNLAAWYLEESNMRSCIAAINPLTAMIFNLNCHPHEVVSRYRDPQLQVGENYSYLFNLRPNMYNFLSLKTHFIINMSWFDQLIKRI